MKKYSLPVAVFLFVTIVLAMVQIRMDPPILVAERFISNGGWIQILFISLYGAFLTLKMEKPEQTGRWRLISWSVFSFVFFLQLALGIFMSDKFLMSGKLHLPVPAMIIAGPAYRGQVTFMVILFLSTIILTGPAWCSHLCYFGAIDGIFSSRRKKSSAIINKKAFRHTLLAIVIATALLFRLLNYDAIVSTVAGIVFGATGMLIILIFSSRKGTMVHCIAYCPVGTVVNYLKFANPFRLVIDSSCTYCNSCTKICRYDAMSKKDLERKKPGISCTLCGDCISICPFQSIYYKFPGLSPGRSRKLYLFLTISLHTLFLAIAKI